MRLKFIVLACFLSASLIPPLSAKTSTHARRPIPQQAAKPAGPPLTYDSRTMSQQIASLTIAGLAWGDREPVVLAKLREAGFTVTNQDDDRRLSFDELVETYIREGEYRPLYVIDTRSFSIQAEKPNERVKVEMWVAPDGWRASTIVYEYTGGIPPRELEKDALEKYRGLGFKIDGSSGWNIVCLPTAQHWGELPHITIQPTGGQFILELSGGQSGNETFSQPFEEAIAKRKGLTKPSF